MVGSTKSTPGAVQPSTLGKFVTAGLAACIGDMVTFPLDTAKVRLQIQGEGTTRVKGSKGTGGGLSKSKPSVKPMYRGMYGTIMTISRQEGPKALYNGLAAGLQRQMAFASVRIGLYDTVKRFYMDQAKQIRTLTGKPSNKQSSVSVTLRILAGITTGGMAVLVAQPTDVVKVRLQAQPQGSTRYTGVTHAFKKIAYEEGFRGLWKGTLPNVTRNAVVNASELVAYDLIKEFILHRQLLEDNMPCHFTSAFGAGFCTTVIASPVDVVKTRFMNAPHGKYSGAVSCAVQMFHEGGPKAFYKGFMPSFLRLGSWNIVMFVCFEQLKRVAINMGYVQHEAIAKRAASSGAADKPPPGKSKLLHV